MSAADEKETQSYDSSKGSTQAVRQSFAAFHRTTSGALAALEADVEKRLHALEEAQRRLAADRHALDQERKRMSQLAVKEDDVVSLNVGGERMDVKRSTLCLFKDSALAQMFSGRWEGELERDKDGRVFLDYDPVWFRKVVDYLRLRRMAQPGTLPPLPRVDEEIRPEYETFVQSLGLGQHLLPLSHHSTGHFKKDDGHPSPNSGLPEGSTLKDAQGCAAVAAVSHRCYMLGPTTDANAAHFYGVSGNVEETGSYGNTFRTVTSFPEYTAVLSEPLPQDRPTVWAVTPHLPAGSNWIFAGVFVRTVAPDMPAYADHGSYGWSGNGFQWVAGHAMELSGVSTLLRNGTRAVLCFDPQRSLLRIAGPCRRGCSASISENSVDPLKEGKDTSTSATATTSSSSRLEETADDASAPTSADITSPVSVVAYGQNRKTYTLDLPQALLADARPMVILHRRGAAFTVEKPTEAELDFMMQHRQEGLMPV